MLTGQRRVRRRDASTDVLAAVLTKEPDWAALPATTSALSVELLRRCLEKDPRKRLRDIGDARLILEEPFESEHRGTRRGSVDRRSWLAPALCRDGRCAGGHYRACWLLPRIRGAHVGSGCPLTQFDAAAVHKIDHLGPGIPAGSSPYAATWIGDCVRRRSADGRQQRSTCGRSAGRRASAR